MTVPERTPPRDMKIETRMAARHVEEIIRLHFDFPESLDVQIAKLSSDIATDMAHYFLQNTWLLYSHPHGEA